MCILPRPEASQASDAIEMLKTLYIQLKSVKASRVSTLHFSVDRAGTVGFFNLHKGSLSLHRGRLDPKDDALI